MKKVEQVLGNQSESPYTVEDGRPVDVLVTASKKRLEEIDVEMNTWRRNQNPKLDVDYFNRKERKKFKKEIKEIYAIELFLSLKDPKLIGNYISVE